MAFSVFPISVPHVTVGIGPDARAVLAAVVPDALVLGGAVLREALPEGGKLLLLCLEDRYCCAGFCPRRILRGGGIIVVCL